jgi:hypothetical protein
LSGLPIGALIAVSRHSWASPSNGFMSLKCEPWPRQALHLGIHHEKRSVKR